VFKGDTQARSLAADARSACFQCHQKATNSVFSSFRN
jgi:cytochrome c551/c552